MNSQLSPTATSSPAYTKAEAMTQLLRHGPLSFFEAVEITGWKRKCVEKALRKMASREQVERFFVPGRHRFVYRLPEHINIARVRAFVEGAGA